jgi:peptidylprolyl isomerase
MAWYLFLFVLSPKDRMPEYLKESPRLALSALALVVLLSGFATAQDSGPTVADGVAAVDAPEAWAENLPPDDPDFDNAAASAEFQATLDQWRQTLVEINGVTIQYRNADPDNSADLKEQHRVLETRARGEFDQAFRQAYQLVKRAPRKNLVAAQFLLVGTHYRVGRDWYEMTGEAAELLLQVAGDNRRLPEIAGVSLFATNQFERARPFLTQAVELGLLDQKNFGLLEKLDDFETAWQREREFRLAEAEKGDLPRVKFTTTRGDFVLELYEDHAPNTVANFIRLVEEGAYRGVPFYQVLESRIALAGDLRMSPMTLGFRIADERDRPDRRDFFRGTIGMAKIPNPEADQDPNSDKPQTIPDSASSHFFIAFQPLPLDKSDHTAFGRIVEGIENFSALTRVDPSEKKEEGTPVTEPDFILSAEVLRKRDHPYEPERIKMQEN